jgi:hypothetical protein
MYLALDPNVIKALKNNGLKPTRRLVWLDAWGAQITLTLTIDEKSSLNPGVVFNTPMIGSTTYFPNNTLKTPFSVATPQSYNLGLGGQFSADATRKETLSLYIGFDQFMGNLSKQFVEGSLSQNKVASLLIEATAQCPNENGIFIQSDLKLKEWMEDVTLPAREQEGLDYASALAAEAKAAKKDVISHEVTFVIVYGGNITPTWKLVRVSADTGSGTFLGATRTKTQDLVITMGPPQSTTVNNTILAAQIGQSVASAIRSTQ